MNSTSENIAPDWSIPAAPTGFPLAIAVYHQDGSVTLEWSRHPQRDFASEHGIEVNIEWPFNPGVKHVISGKPDKALWEQAGILPIW